ncbi:MAG: zinc ABC transporter substrate-binding protein [Nigerium sp.]|nr:zinc ABC transporter substrate-binding protein [Nigerium sp.]
MRLLPALSAGLGLFLVGCSAAAPGGTAAPGAPAPVAVATTTHLGSLLGDIASCAGSTSATLMGPGDDPHDFSVSSSEVATMIRSGLVVANGLGLEGGLASVLASVQGEGATVFEVAPRLSPLRFADLHAEEAEEHAHEDEAHEGHDHGAYDPHVHLDAGRMATAAELMGAELATHTGNQAYAGCGEKVAATVRDADAQVREILSVIPEENRVLVTDHEAYNYFAQAYGFQVSAVVIPGGSTDAEPSSADLAAIVRTIKHENVTVIFSNNTVNPRLMEAIARESGTQVRIVELFEGSLGPPGSDADTYAGMMITNAHRIADALK